MPRRKKQGEYPQKGTARGGWGDEPCVTRVERVLLGVEEDKGGVRGEPKGRRRRGRGNEHRLYLKMLRWSPLCMLIKNMGWRDVSVRKARAT